MEPGKEINCPFMYVGDLIHIMGLPVCMLRPVSLLEDLSVFLDFIYILYSKE